MNDYRAVTAQEQIAKLESLLERIRRNAVKPRPVVAAPIQAELVEAAKPEPAAPPPKPAAIPVAEAPPIAAEEVSLEALGAKEARSAAPPAARERVQSADMEELEIVEIASDVVELAPDASASAGSDAALEEPVPESAPRPAVQSVEVEIEPPIKTPPPESGRQAVTPPPAMPEPRVPVIERRDDDFDEDDLVEAENVSAPISIGTSSSPTSAQIGETVHIEAAPEKKEVELAAASPAPAQRVDPLAATVPDARAALGFAKTVPDAQSPFVEAVRATTETRAEEPAKGAEAVAEAAPALVVERPPLDVAHAAEVILTKPARVPETFLELLDQSLELRI